jgi:adenylosuccinate lyase
VGRQTAHDIVYECSMRAVEHKLPFRQTLAEHPVVSQHLSGEEIERLIDPIHYTGLAGVFVDRVIQNQRRLQGESQ